MLPEPYYQTELGALYRGDCLEIMTELPDKSVDLVLTDPPYGLNYNDGDLASRWEAIFGGKLERMKPNPINNDGEEAHLLSFAILSIA